MLKLFTVQPENYDYDQFDEATIVAASAKEAIELAKTVFEPGQGELTAREVDMLTPGVVSTSFVAG